MKVTNLALLLTLVILRTDAFRLPQLDKTEKDPLHLSKLFQAMTSFFKGIDTKEESNLKYHVNVTKRTPLLGPNPNAFFPYAHYASIPKSNGNQTNINWNTYYTFKELEEFAVRYFTVWRSIRILISIRHIRTHFISLLLFVLFLPLSMTSMENQTQIWKMLSILPTIIFLLLKFSYYIGNRIKLLNYRHISK